MVSESIHDSDMESIPSGLIKGCLSVWPCNPIGHKEDVVSAWGCLSHTTLDMGESSKQYMSISSF